jgi:peptide/nickel transport system substrate-binding protein
MKKTLFILLGFILVISMLLVACKSTTTTTTSTTKPTATTTTTTKPATTTTATTTTTTAAAPTGDKYGGTWTEALTVAPSRPIGYVAEAAPDSFTDASPALESLVAAQLDGTIVPRLATSWTTSADGMSITLALRKGVKFHDGSDFNADVAVWNLNLVLAAKQSGTVGVWKSIEKVDDYTIRINFVAAGNTNLIGLSSGVTQQISKAYFDKNGIDACRWHPVGTGAFIFKSYDTGSKITYTRNPNYWDPTKPYLDSVVLNVVPDTTVQKLAFQKGDINRLPSSGLDAYNLQQAGYPAKTAPGGTYMLIPDSAVATQPWSNVNVRLAASYALDRDSLAKALGLGFLKPAYQIYPGYADTHINGLVPTAFDQAKAKDLLRQAGYPTGFKATIHNFGRMITSTDWTTAIAAQLRAVGLDITTDFPEAGAYDNLRYNGWSDGLLNHGLNAFADHNQVFTFYFTGTMFPSMKRPNGFIDGVNASLATPQVDPAKIQAVLQLMYDDMTVIPYVEQTQVAFYKKGSNDPDADAFGLAWPLFRDCYIDKSAR